MDKWVKVFTKHSNRLVYVNTRHIVSVEMDEDGTTIITDGFDGAKVGPVCYETGRIDTESLESAFAQTNYGSEQARWLYGED